MMADLDEVARRREIRRRKILDNSEARWIKIIGHDKTERKDESRTTTLPSEIHLKDRCSLQKENNHDITYDTVSDISPQYTVNNCASEIIEETIPKSNESIHSVHSEVSRKDDLKDRNFHKKTSLSSFPERSKPFPVPYYSDSMAANGTTRRRFSPSHAYAFPKKVSDAESRSYGKTKADACRRSSCTQLMIETLQLSSLSLAGVRPWIVMIVAVLVRLLLSVGSNFSFFPQNIFLPFGILEITMYISTKYFHQGISRSPQSMLGAALILCGVTANFVTRLTNHFAILSDIGRDFSVYLFSFVIFHILCWDWLN